MGTSPFIARRRRALQTAAELLDELDIDQEQPIDVFDVIGQLGLWLMFRPLKNLLGAIVPKGNGGIMITTERQSTIQRYTAAHEIGHWTLDHNWPAFDTEYDILNPGADERERLAQWFASYFLMPPPLVYFTASRHGVQSGSELSPAQAYLVARDMRVSYEAALWQMANLGVITDHHRATLMDVMPLHTKQNLAYGHRPRIGNADVWPVTGPSGQHTVEMVDVVIDDEIVIALPENRTTGYRWLDDAANEGRAALRARSAPSAFAAPTSFSAQVSPQQSPPRRTAADVNAALSLLPSLKRTNRDTSMDDDEAGDPRSDAQTQEGLLVVYDDYQPGWARTLKRDAAPLRRYIAGAAIELANVLAPVRPTTVGEVGPRLPDPANPGAGATGRRILGLQARAEGQFIYVLHYAAKHDPHTPPAASFTVEAAVTPQPGVLHQRTLRRALLQMDLDDDSDQEIFANNDDEADDASIYGNGPGR